MCVCRRPLYHLVSDGAGGGVSYSQSNQEIGTVAARWVRFKGPPVCTVRYLISSDYACFIFCTTGCNKALLWNNLPSYLLVTCTSTSHTSACWCYVSVSPVFPSAPEQPGMPCPGEDSESTHSAFTLLITLSPPDNFMLCSFRSTGFSAVGLARLDKVKHQL